MPKRMLALVAGILLVLLVLGAAALTPAVAQAVKIALVRDLDGPARQPFHYTASDFFSNVNGTVQFAFTVPANKRLVVEQVSVRVISTQADTTSVQFTTALAGPVYANSFYTFMRSGGFTVMTDTRALRQFADPGTDVFLYVSRTGGIPGDDPVVASVTGYYVDVP